jgi:two-component system chemotaxis response regulator CheB
MAQVRAQLVPKLQALSGRQKGPSTGPYAPLAKPAGRVRKRGDQAVTVVAIGVSTGGPRALPAVFDELPADLAVPVIVVQHMPASFTGTLAERLDRTARLSVVEAIEPTRVEPGRAYLAPGGRHLAVEWRDGEVWTLLWDGPPENSCRPSVDVLFRSVAAVYGDGALGVMMTGMGSDGLAGSRELIAAGGQLFAQDEETSAVWGMPEAVVRAGLADAIVPLGGIATEILARTAPNARRPGLEQALSARSS